MESTYHNDWISTNLNIYNYALKFGNFCCDFPHLLELKFPILGSTVCQKDSIKWQLIVLITLKFIGILFIQVKYTLRKDRENKYIVSFTSLLPHYIFDKILLFFCILMYLFLHILFPYRLLKILLFYLVY